jgi:hypothetical protein
MAKYNITYKCGHADTIQLYGKTSDRESKAEYYKTILCPGCRVAIKVDQGRAIGLEGSDKQIAWAVDIIADAKQVIAEMKQLILSKGGEINDKFTRAENNLLAHKDAKFWIDNRENLKCLNENFMKIFTQQ